MKRQSKISIRAILSAAVGLISLGGLSAQEQSNRDLPRGITAPTSFPPFNRSAPPCRAPEGLEHKLAFAQDNQRQFMQGVSFGLSLAASDRGLSYRVTLAHSDPKLMWTHLQSFEDEKVGAIVIAPVDAPALTSLIQQMIMNGTYIGMIVPPPAVTLLNAPQYLTGKALGDAAAIYIREKLGGKANVVLLTHDSLQFLSPRFVAMRDALKDMPEVEIVADISPVTVDEAGGFATMQTILLAHPQVDVVLGADTVVLGALAALRSVGKARNDQFLGGIDGEPPAVAEIKRRGPYKASVSLASPVFGYALGQFAADWLAGKSVPQAMDILPHALTAANISQYEIDIADPGSVFRDPDRSAAYLKTYGNICYETRNQYVNFPWSSERK